MFSFFEKLVDPFQPNGNAQPRARRLGRISSRTSSRSAGSSLASLLLTVLNAGIEVWLIGYAGTLVDTLAVSSPADAAGPSAATNCCSWRSSSSSPGRSSGFLREALNDIAFRPNAVLHDGVARAPACAAPVGRLVPQRSRRTHRAAGCRSAGSTGASLAYSVIHTLVYVVGYIVGLDRARRDDRSAASSSRCWSGSRSIWASCGTACRASQGGRRVPGALCRARGHAGRHLLQYRHGEAVHRIRRGPRGRKLFEEQREIYFACSGSKSP